MLRSGPARRATRHPRSDAVSLADGGAGIRSAPRADAILDARDAVPGGRRRRWRSRGWCRRAGGCAPRCSCCVSAGLMLDGWTTGIGDGRGAAAVAAGWSGAIRLAPILELPLGPAWDAAATFRSMRHRRPVLNGVSGYDPPHYEPLKAGLGTRTIPSCSLAHRVARRLRRRRQWRSRSRRRVGALRRERPGRRRSSARTAREPSTRFRRRSDSRFGSGRSLPIVSAWANSQDGSLAVDGRIETEWNDGREQQPGQWLIADLGQVREVAGVTHALGEYARDFPRLLAIDLSLDGSRLGAGLAGPDRRRTRSWRRRDAPIEAPMRFAFEPRQARFVRLRQLDKEIHLWRVAELQVHGAVGSGGSRHSPSRDSLVDHLGDDLRAICRRALGRRGRRRHAIERGAPAAGEQVIVIDEAALQVFRHRVHENVVLHEVAARRVEHGRVVGDALGDDAVAGLGGDDVAGARRGLRSEARCRTGEPR